MRRRLPILVLLLAALAAGGCSGGSESAPQTQPGPPQDTTPTPTRVFKRAELPKLALQPADAPAGMKYTKGESGMRTPADVGLILEQQVAEVRGYGLRGIFDATFDATKGDVRLASRLWLFSEPEGAAGWLKSRRDLAESYQFELLTAPPLGDGGSWAARGMVPTLIITHAFRISNVVVVTTYSSDREQLSESLALAAAEKAVERIRGL